jgi:hypothetical protein
MGISNPFRVGVLPPPAPLPQPRKSPVGHVYQHVRNPVILGSVPIPILAFAQHRRLFSCLIITL